jgi:large subunit ribosomal protein L18
MESQVLKRISKRIKRSLRVRKHIRGSAAKPRLSVMKTNQHIGAQLINDEEGVTLAAASTVMKEFRTQKLGKTKKGAQAVGQKIAAMAKEKQIAEIVFDRGSHKFHGVIAELANAAREAGLKF